MRINTALFGTVDIDEEKIINFESGIPAFPDEKRFYLIHDEDNQNSIFCWLQSVDSPSLVFTLVDILDLKPDYSPVIDEADLKSIGDYNEHDFFIYSIVKVPENIEDITANLKAPIIINAKTLKGRQTITSNEEYEIKCKIYDELKNRK